MKKATFPMVCQDSKGVVICVNMTFYRCFYILRTGEKTSEKGAISLEETGEYGAKIKSVWRKYIVSEYIDIVQSNYSSCHDFVICKKIDRKVGS
ncbi:hypothetical protein Glove_736g7 [Diversispora epigaea]|uniref:Uncharacterized protein n=1 Tax=Diversispora epigaea TaxID=1348612 RepID=A0A397G3B5_9GLOM|nr:hypothetical protein Glove_736g7 [Diversispora epigaea]